MIEINKRNEKKILEQLEKEQGNAKTRIQSVESIQENLRRFHNIIKLFKGEPFELRFSKGAFERGYAKTNTMVVLDISNTFKIQNVRVVRKNSGSEKIEIELKERDATLLEKNFARAAGLTIDNSTFYTTFKMLTNITGEDDRYKDGRFYGYEVY